MIVDSIKSKKAFTMVELLIASAIFSLFMLGVFSLHSIGSKMFMSGTWKYNKQKEAERFLQILKERIEQASVPSKITRTEKGITIAKLPNVGFFVKNSENGNVKLLDGTTYLAEFIVAKPDTSLALASEGLILYHSLYSEPQGKDKLFQLKLYVNETTKEDENFHTANFGKYLFPPTDMDTFIDAASFSANPSEYGFSKVPHHYTLKDVLSVELNFGITATGSTDLGSVDDEDYKKNPIINMTITMQNPKNKETTVIEKMVAKLDWSVYLCPVEFGDE